MRFLRALWRVLRARRRYLRTMVTTVKHCPICGVELTSMAAPTRETTEARDLAGDFDRFRSFESTGVLVLSPCGHEVPIDQQP